MTENPEDIVGHKTRLDGSHEPLTRGEADAIMKRVREAEAKRNAEMPDTDAALSALHDAHTRLRDLGWREAQYCPKDGTAFAIIEWGSTGIFEAHYMGDWPDGRVCVCDFLVHPHGLRFKPLDDLTDAERAKMDKCMAHDRVMRDAEINAMIQTDQAST